MFAYSAESTFIGALTRRVRQVVEAHAGAEVAGARGGAARRRAKKRSSCRRHVAAQQRVVAGHGRVGGVHQRVPVDLVQADRRVAPEGAARGAVDRVADLRRRSTSGSCSAVAGAVGVDEAIDDLGVEDEVLAAARRSSSSPSRARATWPRAGLGRHERRRARRARSASDAGAVVVAGRAVVALHRGDAVA